MHPFTNQNYIYSLIAGCSMSMVIMNDGTLWTWGENSYGQIGNGTTEYQYMPVRVLDYVIMASNSFGRTMAVQSNVSLWAWGNNSGGFYGNNTTKCSYVPIKIFDNVSFVSVGDFQTAVIKNDGSLWVWGALEQDYYFNIYWPPTPTKIMDDVIYVSVSSSHAMAITGDGVLFGWGFNFDGGLGIGIVGCLDNIWWFEHQSLPPVPIMENVRNVVVGLGNTFVITNDGALLAWGENRSGSLGDGTRMHQIYPVKIMDDVSYISLGRAITSDGVLWGWGRAHLYPVIMMDNVLLVSSMGQSLAKTYNGDLWYWADNIYGQLGFPVRLNNY